MTFDLRLDFTMVLPVAFFVALSLESEFLVVKFLYDKQTEISWVRLCFGFIAIACPIIKHFGTRPVVQTDSAPQKIQLVKQTKNFGARLVYSCHNQCPLSG